LGESLREFVAKLRGFIAFPRLRNPACGYGSVKIFTRFLLILLLCSVGARASLRTAWQARTALGPDVWTRLVRIENTNSHSIYPKIVFATVFEFSGILWFYTDVNGTQSLSLHRGLLAAEEADFAPLLKAIEVGFVSFAILPDAGPAWTGTPPPLLNGCFIDSIVALRAVLGRNEPVTAAALLCYYAGKDAVLAGHTVLAYETAAGLFVIDSAISGHPFKLRRSSLSSEPVKVAAMVAAGSVRQARWLLVDLPGENPAVLANASRQLATLGSGGAGRDLR
jgi:hypothetical protein